VIGTTSLKDTSRNYSDGLRPVDLRTDLAPLADLIELVFKDSMDSSGRAALREMRYLSRMGPGLRVLARFNDMAVGINLGYVWIANGDLVGNVSVYPANWPGEAGRGWIIANVGTHPEYQNRGIARRLMLASMRMLYERGGDVAVLQVDTDNAPARHLYRSLGFVEERAWTTWRRSAAARIPPALEDDIFIRRRRRAELDEEMTLARRVRPDARGGLGWLRPLHPSFFRRSLFQQITDWINLRGMERLVARAPHEQRLAASLWLEKMLAGTNQLTLLHDPATDIIYTEALLNNVVRRNRHAPLLIEHPADDEQINTLLRAYNFAPRRTVMHMRWHVQPVL